MIFYTKIGVSVQRQKVLMFFLFEERNKIFDIVLQQTLFYNKPLQKRMTSASLVFIGPYSKLVFIKSERAA